ncbi:hypothetical protein Tco_0262095 [Tanacetum coccineum]
MPGYIVSSKGSPFSSRVSLVSDDIGVLIGNIIAEGEIDNLTMEQYLALTRGNHAPSMVKPEIGGNVNFEIKSQFMRELREDTFFRNKNDDAHEHVERVLDILLNGGYTDFLHELSLAGTSLKRPLSKGTMNCQLLDSQGIILGMTPAQKLTAIQTMTDHSQKWYDGSSSMNIDNSSNSEGIATIVSKLDSLGRDIKKLKENVHAIQVGCQLCGGAHLDKECPLNKEVKSIEEVKYGDSVDPFQTTIEMTEELIEEYRDTTNHHRAHDKIIQGLKTKVRTLTNEVEERTNGFSDNERQETDKSGMKEALATLDITLEIKEVPQEKKQSVSYYVEPYEPPIPFPRRLEHHAEEALVYETMESLKTIKINRPLLE